MAKARVSKKAKGGGRGSAEAIEKRRAARQLNTLFNERSKGQPGLDGRTEKRRRRLLAELEGGRRGKPLKAIEVLQHTHELLEIGESLSAIRKTGFKAPKVTLSPEDLEILARTQKAYEFRPEAWKMLGLEVGDDEAVRPKVASRRGGKATRKKR